MDTLKQYNPRAWLFSEVESCPADHMQESVAGAYVETLAADAEIAALRAENERLRGALAEIARLGPYSDCPRIARRALAADAAEEG